MHRKLYRPVCIGAVMATALATPAWGVSTVPDMEGTVSEDIEIETELSEETEPETTDTEEINDGEDMDEQARIEQYLDYVESLENPVLTAEEEEAGYQIIDGQKYSPEEIRGDSSSEDVIYGGTMASSVTGYVTFVANVPEYIHEEVYVNIINMNTYKIYGCRLYEVNGYSAQICVPSGIYMVNEGGLTADVEARFYMRGVQFQVKRGSVQTLVVEVVDTEPERADEAYHDTNPSNEMEEAATPSDAQSNTPEASVAESRTETSAATETGAPTKAEDTQEEESKTSWISIALLTLAFTGIPLGVLLYLWNRDKKNKRGFYD